MPDLHFACDGERGGVNLKDGTEHLRRGDRADIGTDVHLTALERHVPAVGQVHLGDMSRLQVHDLNLMRTVDDGI